MEKEQQKEQQLADMKVVPMPANGDVELGGAGKHQHHEVRSSMQLEDGAPPDPNSTLTDVAHCQVVWRPAPASQMLLRLTASVGTAACSPWLSCHAPPC